MRETGSNGKTIYQMPKDRTTAVNKLAHLSALSASREWERAAYIALLVKPAKRGGQAKRNPNVRDSEQEQYNVAEFVRKGIYGFRSEEAVRAYLKAWKLSGQPVPEWGGKVEEVAIEFPDVKTLYGRIEPPPADEPEPEPDPIDEADDDQEEDDVADQTPDRGTNPRPNATERLLRAFSAVDPADVITDKRDHVMLLIKTMESWLESLREALAEISD